MAKDLEIAVRERQFYYEKLRQIEIVLQNYSNQDNYLATKICNILYQVEVIDKMN